MNIQELAEKAGMTRLPADRQCRVFYWDMVIDPELERFADQVLEEAAKVCDERAMKNERACDGLDDEDATSLRSAAWQMSICAADIRALKGAKE